MSKLTTPKSRPVVQHLVAHPSSMDDNRDITKRPPWVPPKWEPVRPGADDHKQFQSRGTPA